MKKKLLTLAKEMDFSTEVEYFNYLIECHTNGNFESCKRLFSEMRKEDQKVFIKYVDDSFTEKAIRNFYFNLL